MTQAPSRLTATKKVTVLGAGRVTRPLVRYFLEICGYEVTVLDLVGSSAESMVAGHPLGRTVAGSAEDQPTLDRLVRQADLVVSMLPPNLHPRVARSCLDLHRPLVTTSYICPEMQRLDAEARQRGVLLLNEIGEDPGLDHMSAMKLLDQVRGDGGEVIALSSYGAGLPSLRDPQNPVGYKLSWSPRGLLQAAKAPAAYMERGKRVHVPAERLFACPTEISIVGLGLFETYPNRDSTRYLPFFGLPSDGTLFRGLLRPRGWCAMMNALGALGYLSEEEMDLSAMTYRQLTTTIAGQQAVEEPEILERLRWLGLFDDTRVPMQHGSPMDALLERMLERMTYGPDERDMIIVHNEVVARFGQSERRHLVTLVLEGQPGGDSAMSRAVSLPAGIASRLILEEKIQLTGVRMPMHAEIYEPILAELEQRFGIAFEPRYT